MISSPLPTRAEVSDVANAALDYTDAVMLSGETAAGDFPVETVAAMDRICRGAEKNPTSQLSGHRLHMEFERCDETIALAAMYAANHFPHVTAVITLTESGYTQLIMPRIRSQLPIYALPHITHALGRMSLMRGMQSIPFNPAGETAGKVNQHAVNKLLELGLFKSGECVVLPKGDAYKTQRG